MGREWYHWGAKSSKRKGGGGRREEGNSAAAKPQPPPATATGAAAAASCMGAVFHLFHLHQLQLHFHHHCPFDPIQDDPSSLQGVQAPRKSSETEEVMVGTTASMASLSETEPEGDNSTIKMGIRNNTSRSDSMLLRSKSLTPKAKTRDFNCFPAPEYGKTITTINTSRMDSKLLKIRAPSSKAGEEENSDALSSSDSRTPTLVARLMGLDLLPGSCQPSPRPSKGTSQQCNRPLPYPTIPLRSRNSTLNGNGNSEFSDPFGSLPETPGVSLGGSRSDAGGYSYYNHRFSLQMDRGMKMQLVELSRHSCSEINGERRKLSDNEDQASMTSPSHYDTQIMKQVKERVARRRFGADITNTTGEGQRREQRRDEYLLSTKEKKSRTRNDNKRADQSGPGGGLSWSLRTRVPEKPTSQLQHPEPDPVREIRRFKCATYTVLQKQKRAVQEQKQKPLTRNYHGTTKRGSVNIGDICRNPVAQRPLRLNKKDEQFVRVAMDSSRKRAGQDSEKKCERTPLSSELLHEKQEIVLKKKAQAIEPNTIKTLQPRNDLHAPPKPTSTTTNAPAAATAEFRYMTRILLAAGINRDTRVSSSNLRWFSPSHPLDPVLFLRLEEEQHSTTDTATSPTELSLPCNRRLIFDAVNETLARNFESTDAGRPQEFGFQVMRMVLAKVRGVEKDISGSGTDMDTGFVAREGELDEIVEEIEREMVEKLVLDTVAVMGW